MLAGGPYASILPGTALMALPFPMWTQYAEKTRSWQFAFDLPTAEAMRQLVVKRRAMPAIGIGRSMAGKIVIAGRTRGLSGPQPLSERIRTSVWTSSTLAARPGHGEGNRDHQTRSLRLYQVPHFDVPHYRTVVVGCGTAERRDVIARSGGICLECDAPGQSSRSDFFSGRLIVMASLSPTPTDRLPRELPAGFIL